MEMVEVQAGYEDVLMELADEGCSTPKRQENQIAVICVPPAAPKKKRFDYGCKGQQQPPKNGFFQPPDLELLFVMPPRRHQACA